MDGLERDTMFLRHLLHPWYPIIGVGTLIGVIQNKTVIFNRRMLRAFPELRHLCSRFNGKVHEIDPAVGYVCHTEPFVGKEFRVSKKFPLPALRAQNANTFLPLRLGLIRDDSIVDYDDLPDPVESGEEAIANMEEAVDLLKSVVRELRALTEEK